MYKIIDAQTQTVIEETVNPVFLKQQKFVDRPISANGLFEADGVLLSDNETMLGIEGKRMQNYTPTVRVVEVSSDAYLLAELNRVKAQVDNVHAYQTESTILKSELDESYREGVNSL